jgi:hypothetical protein
MMHSKLGLGMALVTTMVVATLGAPRAAHAEDKKAIKKVEEANAKAMEEYDLLEFENAKKILNGALVDVKKSGLSQHPIAAKTHGNLGIVYEGLGDPDNALLEFIAALEIDSKWGVPKEYKKPELKKIYDSAKATVAGNAGGGGGSAGGGGKDVEPAGGAGDDGGGAVSGLVHQPVEEGKEGTPVAIGVKVGDDVSASQVVLYYRAQGQEDFTAMPLHHGAGAGWEGKIPASATKSDSIQYYIEAKGSGGKVNASAGSRGSPNIIEIARSTSGGGGGGGGGADADDENPLGSAGGDGTSISKTGGGSAMHTVFVNVSVGSGFGFVSGNTEQSGQAVTCCVASAPFHVMPELGFWVAQKVALSVYGRIGLPLGADIPGHAPAAPAGLLRLLYVFDRSGEGLSVHGDLGGGFIRHNIKLDAEYMGGTVDTVATGPLLVGGGASWAHTLGGPLRFVLDLNVLAGIPVAELGGVKPYFSANADLNIGFQLAF